MSASLRALFPDAGQAQDALAHVERHVPLTGSMIVDGAGVERLRDIGLAPEAVAEAAAEIEGGGVLLVLVVADRAALADVRAALDDRRAGQAEPAPADAPTAAGPGLLTAPPLVLRSHARVTIAAEPDSVPEAEPARGAAPLPAEALAAAGLFAGRQIDFAETREEALVARRVAVREELVVRKSVEERIERVSGSVRRTEIAVDALPSRRSGAFVARGTEPYEPPPA